MIFGGGGFPGDSLVKNPANAGAAGDACSIPESGRSPGGGTGNPLQYSCQDNPMDRGGWQAIQSWAHKESDAIEAVDPTLCFRQATR